MQAVGRIEHGGLGLLDVNGKAFVASDDMLKGGGGKGLCQMKARARGVRLLPWQAVPDKAVRGGKDAFLLCGQEAFLYGQGRHRLQGGCRSGSAALPRRVILLPG